MNRDRKLYKSIGEVSKEISISTHTLRFWEKEFRQIKPITFDANRRYYTEKDIDIKKKLGEENYQDEKINVRLHYFICSHINGAINLSEHEDSAWVTKNEFKNYNFAEGDSDIINLL